MLPTLHYALNPGGYLVLGLSEGSSSFHDLFEAVDSKQRFSQKKQTRRSTPSLSVRPALVHPGIKVNGGRRFRRPPDVRRSGDRVLLRRLSPCG